MSQPSTNPELDTIWQLRFDKDDTSFTFVKRLAFENAWSVFYAERVVEEYRRFLFLVHKSQVTLSPSDAVDQAWHLHMIYSRSYWDDLCGQILKKPLHHDPIDGGGKDRDTFIQQYEQTLSIYRDTFKEEAPADIWPNSSVRFADSPHFQRVDMRHYVRKPSIKWRLGFTLGGLVLGAWMFNAVLGAVVAGSILFTLVASAFASGGTGEGCGTGTGGGADGDGGGCGGCGGGCGGCGGCGG